MDVIFVKLELFTQNSIFFTCLIFKIFLFKHVLCMLMQRKMTTHIKQTDSTLKGQLSLKLVVGILMNMKSHFFECV